MPAAFDRWEDVSKGSDAAEDAVLGRQIDALSDATGSEGLYRILAERRRREIRWRMHAFPINHLLGVPNQAAGGLRIPFYLATHIPLVDVADADRHARLVEASGDHLQQLAERIRAGARAGIALPAQARKETLNVIEAMIMSGGDIASDFARRSGNLPDGERDQLARRVNAAVAGHFVPGLDALRAAIHAMPAAIDGQDGVWALPDGEAFYADALTDWTADHVDPVTLHAEATDAVARLQDQVAALSARLGYPGGFRAAVDALRADPDAYYRNDPAGRQACLTRARALTNAIAAVLPAYFSRIPHTPLKVIEVEPARAASAVFGDYSPPSGSRRAGRYYLNLADMSKLPRHELAALSFHEGLPGHHLQIAAALDNESLAAFEQRPFLFEGFAEGWAMYSEELGFEMLGDMLDDRDRLGLCLRQLWMAVRAVVDTGLHAMRWSRAQVVETLLANTGVARSLAEAEADRYAVWPAQACAYHVGRTTLQALRDQAGPDRTRAFHDQILGGGAIPLWQLRTDGQWDDQARGA